MKQLLELLLADMPFIKKTLKNQLFLFLPSRMRAKQDIHVKDVVDRVVLTDVLAARSF
jgi:hypothetical protein